MPHSSLQSNHKKLKNVEERGIHLPICREAGGLFCCNSDALLDHYTTEQDYHHGLSAVPSPFLGESWCDLNPIHNRRWKTDPSHSLSEGAQEKEGDILQRHGYTKQRGAENQKEEVMWPSEQGRKVGLVCERDDHSEKQLKTADVDLVAFTRISAKSTEIPKAAPYVHAIISSFNPQEVSEKCTVSERDHKPPQEEVSITTSRADGTSLSSCCCCFSSSSIASLPILMREDEDGSWRADVGVARHKERWENGAECEEDKAKELDMLSDDLICEGSEFSDISAYILDMLGSDASVKSAVKEEEECEVGEAGSCCIAILPQEPANNDQRRASCSLDRIKHGEEKKKKIKTKKRKRGKRNERRAPSLALLVSPRERARRGIAMPPQRCRDCDDGIDHDSLKDAILTICRVTPLPWCSTSGVSGGAHDEMTLVKGTSSSWPPPSPGTGRTPCSPPFHRRICSTSFIPLSASARQQEEEMGARWTSEKHYERFSCARHQVTPPPNPLRSSCCILPCSRIFTPPTPATTEEILHAPPSSSLPGEPPPCSPSSSTITAAAPRLLSGEVGVQPSWNRQTSPFPSLPEEEEEDRDVTSTSSSSRSGYSHREGKDREGSHGVDEDREEKKKNMLVEERETALLDSGIRTTCSSSPLEKHPISRARLSLLFSAASCLASASRAVHHHHVNTGRPDGEEREKKNRNKKEASANTEDAEKVSTKDRNDQQLRPPPDDDSGHDEDHQYHHHHRHDHVSQDGQRRGGIPLSSLSLIASSFWEDSMNFVAVEVCKALKPLYPLLLSALVEAAEEEAKWWRRKSSQDAVVSRHLTRRICHRIFNDMCDMEGEEDEQEEYKKSNKEREDERAFGTLRGGCRRDNDFPSDSSVSSPSPVPVPYWEDGWISLRTCVDVTNRVQQQEEEERGKKERKANIFQHNEGQRRNVRVTLTICEYIIRRYGQPSTAFHGWKEGRDDDHPPILLWPVLLNMDDHPEENEDEYRVGWRHSSFSHTTPAEEQMNRRTRVKEDLYFERTRGLPREQKKTQLIPVVEVITLMAAMVNGCG